MTDSLIKQQPLSNSLPIENNFENNFLSESNYSKRKKGKILGSVNEFKNNNYKQEKQLSNIKESVEREKSSKIEKSEKEEKDKDKNEIEIKRKDNKKYLGVIGNIRELDNFDDLFK